MESFEESAGGVYGDLLSKPKVRRPARIGLLTCGYYEYWRMYPGLKAQVAADLAAVERRLSAMGAEIVPSGLVDTLDGADAAGALFAGRAVDAVVCVLGTYVPDFITLHALDAVADKPALLFSIQKGETLDPKGDYQQSLRNSGVIGAAQLSGTFMKMGRANRVVVGSVADEAAYRQIDDFIRAVQAVEDVHEANIGVIGHVFRGMYDLELSKTFFKRTFGVNVINIQSGHLLDAWQSVDGEEVDRQTVELLARFSSRDVAADDVGRALRLSQAMEDLATRFRLDALCFLDQHFIQRQTRTTARMGASLMMERTARCAACEGDLGGLVMMMLMRSLGGRAALMGEWGEYDAAMNCVLVIGHGIGTPDLAACDDWVTLTPTPEPWGLTGSGLNYELILRPGSVTVGHFIETPSGYRMLVSPAQSVEHPTLRYNEIHALLRVKTPVKEYLQTILNKGAAHHCIVCPGELTPALLQAASLLHIEPFYIE